MHIVQQKRTLPIVNHDDSTRDESRIKRHGELLPNSIRCLICGPSNCGKTNVMLSLLQDPNGLRFENVYIYGKALQQPKYEFLKQLLEPIKGMGYYAFTENEAVIPPTKAKPNSIMIFDDVMTDKQNVMRDYFSMGRHNEIDCFYLCQTYTRVPKHLIRDNANMLVVFKQDDMNLRHIYSDQVGTDLNFQQFHDMCSECWKDNHGFLVIDKDSGIGKGRYRKGFDGYICM